MIDSYNFLEGGRRGKSRHSVPYHWTGPLDQNLPLHVTLTSLLTSSKEGKEAKISVFGAP
jgi:hypothetical protein